MQNNCGVYGLTVGDYIYIGSSCQLEKRKMSHLRLLKRGSHPNKKLQSVWDGDYKFDILEYCDEELLLAREEFHIKNSKNCVSQFPYSDHTNDFSGELKSRILSKVKIDKNGCWIFTGKCKDGYGRITNHGKTLLTHRVMYYLEHGHYPYLVGHSCENKNCCNPSHLYSASYADIAKEDDTEFAQKFKETFSRLGGRKWDVIDSLGITESVYHRYKLKFFKGYSYKFKYLEAFGETKKISDWLKSDLLGDGVTHQLILRRLELGWSAEQAIQTAVESIQSEEAQQTLEEARGFYLYGYPISKIHHRHKNSARVYGNYLIPEDASRYTYYLSDDKKTNIHDRRGQFYYVIDGNISEGYLCYAECVARLFEVTGGTEAIQEYEKYKGVLVDRGTTTPASQVNPSPHEFDQKTLP